MKKTSRGLLEKARALPRPGPAKLTLRIVVTLSIFVLILRHIDVAQVWRILANASPLLLLAALILQFGSATLSAFRWQLIMRNLRFGLSVSFYLRSYYKAMFFNQGLPTSIGGDALRVLDVAVRGFRKRDALFGVMLDRVAGLAALLVMNLAGFMLGPGMLPDALYKLTLIAVVVGLAAYVVMSLLRFLPTIEAYPGLGVLRALAERLHRAFLSHRAMLFGSSLLIPLLALLSFYATGSALGLRYDLLTYVVIVPPAIILTLVPVSLAGWGVREGALVGLFSFIGADKAVILTMSVLYGLMQIVVSLPGFIIYLSGRRDLR